METMQSSHENPQAGGSEEEKAKSHVCLLQGKLAGRCCFKAKASQGLELGGTSIRTNCNLFRKIRGGISRNEKVPYVHRLQKARQKGNKNKCLRTKCQLEKVEETVLISSTSSRRAEIEQDNASCAMVATEAIIYSTQVCSNEDQEIPHGEGSNGGSRDWLLNQRQDQEVEVNSSLGFWAEKRPFLSEEAKTCVAAAWRTSTKSRYETALLDIQTEFRAVDFTQAETL